jgi:hypothetical protein
MGIAIIRIPIERGHILGVICYLLDRGYSFKSGTRSKKKIGMELRLLYYTHGVTGVSGLVVEYSSYLDKAESLFKFLGYSES